MTTTIPAGWKPRLACPFCGSNCLFTEPDEYGSGGQWASPIHVGCNDCKAEQSADTEDEAVERWNRRVPAPASPITVALDPDPRGVSVGVWQGSHCIYSGAHTLPAAPGLSTVEDAGAQKEAVMNAIAGALGDAYDCTRVWHAWSYGTMGPDDFALVAADPSRVAEIATAAIAAMHPAPAAGDAQGSAHHSRDHEHRAIGLALNRACAELPEGWQIQIEVEKGAGTVTVLDPEYCPTDVNGGEAFSDTINEAIDTAVAAQQGKGGA